MEATDRADIMVELYGEAVAFSKAGRIIDRSASTIRNMIEDGRLDAACEGSRVDVRSIARYICAPAKADCEARLRKKFGGETPKWRV